MRRLYADISPGLGWDGRDPEALEAAAATQATPRTVSVFDAAVVAAMDALPRRVAFLVAGTTPAHAPAYADVTGTVDGATVTERVTFPTTSAGARMRGAVSSRKAFAGTDLTIAYPAGSGTGGTVAIGLGLASGIGDVRGKIRYEYLWEALGDRRSTLNLLDPDMVDRISIDASSMVDGRLGTPPGTYLTPFALPPPAEIGRIALDLWLAELGKAHPTVVVVDHAAIRRQAFHELDLLRQAQTGDAGTDTEAPTRPANVGGIVVASGPRTLVDNPDGTFNHGDF